MKTVRARATLAAAIVVAIALTAGGIAFVALLRSSLTSSVQDVAQQRAGEIAARLARGVPPPSLIATGDEDTIVQLVGLRDGKLIGSSDRKLSQPLRAGGTPSTIEQVRISDGTHTYRTVTRKVSTPRGPVLVIVGGSLEHVFESTSTAARMLRFGIPGLLLLVVAVTWLVTRRALRPVEMMRREVADISARHLDRRIPVPATGDEIARLAETMNAMLARLAASSEQQRRFVSDASHELRSPLSNLRALGEVAREHPDDTSVAALAGAALAEEDRLERLVDDLLALARADEDMLVTQREDVDLDDLVLEEAARVRTISNLSIDTSGVSAARVQGDASALRRMVRNLADNAVRHAVSRVSFQVCADGEIATVVVADDGVGVPPTERERIFQRFIRLDTARDRASGGSGLGLSIVAEIVGAHDGSVTVGDAPGHGARFELRLPVIGTATG